MPDKSWVIQIMGECMFDQCACLHVVFCRSKSAVATIEASWDTVGDDDDVCLREDVLED